VLNKMEWWPGTESNRRRQPFQGRLPIRRSGLKSVYVIHLKEVVLAAVGSLGTIWASFGSWMYTYCTRDFQCIDSLPVAGTFARRYHRT
jgi:hypothetical protein